MQRCGDQNSSTATALIFASETGNQTRVNVLTENSEAFELHVLDQNRYSEGEFHLGAPSGRAAEGHRRTTGLL